MRDEAKAVAKQTIAHSTDPTPFNRISFECLFCLTSLSLCSNVTCFSRMCVSGCCVSLVRKLPTNNYETMMKRNDQIKNIILSIPEKIQIQSDQLLMMTMMMKMMSIVLL